MGNTNAKGTTINTGKYLGYTQGRGQQQLPTLYFENGHLTQEHTIPDNVGWHPNGDNHVMLNVQSEKKYHLILGNAKDDLIRKMIVAYYSWSSDKTKICLFEFNEKTVHTSRGQLILVGSIEFNTNYDTTYAKKQIAKAKLANNEK